MSALPNESEAGGVRGLVDGYGRLVSADPALAALHERAGGEARGVLAVPQIAALARLARRLGIVISRSVIAADGQSDLDLWVRAEPLADGQVALIVDGWTRQPARGPAIARAGEREADFLRAGADWTWETDEQLRFTSVSAAAAAAIGQSPGDLKGRQLTRLLRFLEAEEGGLPILNALAEQRGFDDQMAEIRAGQSGRYRLSGVPLIDGNGRFAGFRGSAVRTGGAAEAPARIVETPRPEPRDESAFAERLNQALRGPLGHIIAHAETIAAEADGPINADYAGYASDIAAAGRHLLALVDDLVDLQAIERPDFAAEAEPIDLADVARRAAGLLAVRAAEKNVRIDRPAEGERLSATGDFRRVLQILVNLVGNAVRYSPEGGMVWIRTEQEGDLACVIVADQGRGIAEGDQARVFEKFERVDPSEPGGTGLGLYIARRLARAMGGDIALDSAPGQGARFTLTLPGG